MDNVGGILLKPLMALELACR